MELTRGDAMTFLKKKRLLWGRGGILRRVLLSICVVGVARNSWLSFNELLQQASSDYQASLNFYLFIA